MNIPVLDNSNFLLYCAKNYDNPQCAGTEEFQQDLQRIKYIKKLFTRYQQTGELKERLILNHLIILNNLFGAKVLPRILFFKIDTDHYKYLKPFLVLLNINPPVVYNIGKQDHHIITDTIAMDQKVIDKLRAI